MSPHKLWEQFRGIVDAAGLRRIRFHDLRHSFATLAIEAGVNGRVVSDILGHASVAFTLDTYAHSVPSLQAQATDLVEALVFDGKPEDTSSREEEHNECRTV